MYDVDLKLSILLRHQYQTIKYPNILVSYVVIKPPIQNLENPDLCENKQQTSFYVDIESPIRLTPFSNHPRS